jgi:hypothetical protein
MTDTESAPLMDSSEKEVQEETKFPMDQFLDHMGLSTPIDYLFQSFAISKSRQMIKTVEDNLTFLFHLIKTEDLKKEIPFPHAAFIERVYSQSPDELDKYIIWSTAESENWEKRKPLPFTDFHLYFLDVLKPNFQYSAEEIYRIFDAKRGESYFLNNGPRNNSTDRKFHVLFITTKVIVCFQIPECRFNEIKPEEEFICKWVSMSSKTTVRVVGEFAVFELPNFDIVSTPEEKQEMKEFFEADTVCKDCTV